MHAPTTKIVIIDDHDSFRAALKKIINAQPGFVTAGEAQDARQAEEVVRQVNPDLIILDLSLPDRSGLQLTSAFRAAHPAIPIVIVSMHAKIDYVLGALRAGALGYLAKESVSRFLVDACRAALCNEYYLDAALSQEIGSRLLDSTATSDVTNATYGILTSREQQILVLLARGFPATGIADKLSISTKTVANYRSNILNKLELEGTADLVRYAMKLGIIEAMH